jgi:hypothetical protein
MIILSLHYVFEYNGLARFQMYTREVGRIVTGLYPTLSATLTVLCNWRLARVVGINKQYFGKVFDWSYAIW